MYSQRLFYKKSTLSDYLSNTCINQPNQYLLRLLTLLTLFLFSTTLKSQPSQVSYVLTKGVNDGLADRTILNTIGDSTGHYYIQTHSSIQKYYNNRVLKTLHLESYNDAQPIYQYDNYIFRLNLENCISIIDKEELLVIDTWCIESVTDQEPLLVSRHPEGFNFLIEIKQNQFIIIKARSRPSGTIAISETKFSYDGDIAAFNLDSKGTIFIINDKDQLVVVGDTISHHNPIEKEFHKAHKASIFVSPGDQIIYSLSNNEGIYAYQTSEPLLLNTTGFIQSINWDEEGSVLIGVTKNVPLHQYELLHFSKNYEKEDWSNLLKYNDRIINITSDNFRRSFIASTYNGIYYFEFLPQGINLHLYQQDLRGGEFGAFLRSFTNFGEGRVLMVKEGGGPIYIYKNGTVSEFQEMGESIGYGTISIHYEESSNYLWILQYHRSGYSILTSFDRNTGTIKKIDIPVVIGERLHVTDKYIWVTGRLSDDGKIVRVNRKNSSYEVMFDEHTKNRQIRASYFTDSLYLFGTREGMIAYSPTKKRILTKVDSLTKNLSISHITKINDQYLIGTYGNGLTILDENFNHYKNTMIGNSSSINTIASIEKDDTGYYWISTFDGIAILDSAFNLKETLFANEGLSYSEFNRAASIKINESLLFGNTNGFISINPDNYYNQRSEVNLKLDKIEFEEEDNKVTHTIKEHQNRIIGNPKRITLHYYNPGFDIKNTNPYLDRKRITISPPIEYEVNNRTIRLVNPKYKDYEIEVRSAFNNLSEPLIKTNLKVVVDTSHWFKLIGTFISTLLVCFLIGIVIVKQIRKKAKHEIALNKKYAEIKLQALRSQLNPHFVFNALSSIQYYIQTNEKKKARDFLNKFSKLMRSTLESSHFNKIKLSQELEQISLYLELELLRFEDRWSYLIDVDDNIEPSQISIPSMLIQPLVENSIKHGLSSNLSRKGLLRIELKRIEDGLKISVDDNGIGRKASEKKKKENQSKHISLSSIITKERIATMNQSTDHNIRLEYMDKYNDDGKAMGTTAEIYMAI